MLKKLWLIKCPAILQTLKFCEEIIKRVVKRVKYGLHKPVLLVFSVLLQISIARRRAGYQILISLLFFVLPFPSHFNFFATLFMRRALKKR